MQRQSPGRRILINPLEQSPLFYTKKVAIVILAVIACWQTQALVNAAAQESNSSSNSGSNKESNAELATDSEPISGYAMAFPALGTRVAFKAFSDDEQLVSVAFEKAKGLVLELENVLTDYDPASETRQLTELAVNKPVTVSKDLWKILELSDDWNRKTNGVFDPSIGAVTKVWRKYQRAGRAPPKDAIDTALLSSGWKLVELNGAEQSVKLQRAEVGFDFGAIGKGYIVDRAFECINSSGLSQVMVDISGNMRCGDAPPDREAWKIGVSPLKRGGEPLRIIPLVNQAIATSGDLWQFVIVDGERRSHILDPRSGRGVLGPVAATVVAPSATTADVVATVACILPPEDAMALADEIDAVELFLARQMESEDGEPQIYETTGFPRP